MHRRGGEPVRTAQDPSSASNSPGSPLALAHCPRRYRAASGFPRRSLSLVFRDARQRGWFAGEWLKRFERRARGSVLGLRVRSAHSRLYRPYRPVRLCAPCSRRRQIFVTP